MSRERALLTLDEVSPNTRKMYVWIASKFEERFPEPSPKAIDEFLANRSPASQKLYIHGLRRYFQDTNHPELLTYLRQQSLKIKPRRKVRFTLKEEHIPPLLNTIRYKHHRGAIDLMLFSGLRRGEVLTVTPGNLDLENQTCLVIGKGDIERIVPINEIEIQDLKPLLEDKGPDKPIFNFSLRGINLFVKEYAITALGAETGTKVAPHTLRRTFATRWCAEREKQDKDIDLISLQMILGHKQLQTTRDYIQYTDWWAVSRYKKAMGEADKAIGEKLRPVTEE